MRDHRGEIVGVVIHVVTIACLRRPAVTAAVMGDYAETFAQEKKHLRIPVVR